jgi:hypothetical protein
LMSQPRQRSLDPSALGGQELSCPLWIHGPTLPSRNCQDAEAGTRWARV